MTEKEKAEFLRIRLERYNAMSHEDKIRVAEIGLRFAREDGDLSQSQKNLFGVISLIIEKIKDRHC
jgi:hypothetical protein